MPDGLLGSYWAPRNTPFDELRTSWLEYLMSLTYFAVTGLGAFFGAWLGGIALVKFGDYSWMWYADMALATLAAFVNLPIREAPLKAAVPQAA